MPSLISSALVLRRCCSSSKEANAVVRSFLMDALRHDRMNADAWYNIGLVHRDEGTVSSLMEAAECFEAAHFLEDTSPVEPFR